MLSEAPAQVQETRDLFSLLDKDGDGVVTDSDLSAMLHSLGIHTISLELEF